MITTKDEICARAVELFRERGVQAVSINQICDHVGVTRGSFYHHFEGKNDLLLYWFTHAPENHIAFEEKGDSPKYCLKQFVLHYAHIIDTIGKDLMYHIFMAELELHGEHFQIYSVHKEYCMALINEARTLGEITAKEQAETLIDLFSAAFIGAVVLWKFQHVEEPIYTTIERLFEKIYH